jgi:hypothetical protein
MAADRCRMTLMIEPTENHTRAGDIVLHGNFSPMSAFGLAVLSRDLATVKSVNAITGTPTATQREAANSFIIGNSIYIQRASPTQNYWYGIDIDTGVYQETISLPEVSPFYSSTMIVYESETHVYYREGQSPWSIVKMTKSDLSTELIPYDTGVMIANGGIYYSALLETFLLWDSTPDARIVRPIDIATGALGGVYSLLKAFNEVGYAPYGVEFNVTEEGYGADPLGNGGVLLINLDNLDVLYPGGCSTQLHLSAAKVATATGSSVAAYVGDVLGLGSSIYCTDHNAFSGGGKILFTIDKDGNYLSGTTTIGSQTAFTHSFLTAKWS